MAFYQRVEGDPRLVKAYATIIEAAEIYRFGGMPNRALRLEVELKRMFERMDAQALRSSRQADEKIRALIQSTKVRPDNTGLLSQQIHSRPIPTVLPSGAFGIADLEDLEKVVNPRAPTRGTYWRAQEEGSTAAVGRVVPGLFEGKSPPDPAQFRQHAYFEQQPYVKGIPVMQIRRPIQARHFLRDGSAVAVAVHLKQLDRIEELAATAMLRV